MKSKLSPVRGNGISGPSGRSESPPSVLSRPKTFWKGSTGITTVGVITTGEVAGLRGKSFFLEPKPELATLLEDDLSRFQLHLPRQIIRQRPVNPHRHKFIQRRFAFQDHHAVDLWRVAVRAAHGQPIALPLDQHLQ